MELRMNSQRLSSANVTFSVDDESCVGEDEVEDLQRLHLVLLVGHHRQCLRHRRLGEGPVRVSEALVHL